MKQCNCRPAFPFSPRGKQHYWYLTNLALANLDTAPGLLIDIKEVVEDLHRRAEQTKNVEDYKYINKHVHFYKQFQAKLESALNNDTS